jgi:hypothetical protein
MADEVVRHVQDVSIVAHHKGIQGHQTLWLAQSIHCRNGVRQDGRGCLEPDERQVARQHQLAQNRDAGRCYLNQADQCHFMVRTESLLKSALDGWQPPPSSQGARRDTNVSRYHVQALPNEQTGQCQLLSI